VSSFVALVPVKEGSGDRVRALLAAGPPFALERTTLDHHQVFVTEHEVVFAFRGPEAKADVERLAADPCVWRAAAEWHEILASRPRVAQLAFEWSRRESSRPDGTV
jgi:hypothetical protein